MCITRRHKGKKYFLTLCSSFSVIFFYKHFFELIKCLRDIKLHLAVRNNDYYRRPDFALNAITSLYIKRLNAVL